MDEYIKRETAVRAVMMAKWVDGSDGAMAMEIVASPAAADVAPVVHGRWSDAGFGELPKHAPYGWACSVCGGISFNNEYIYCPHCGAKMDGGDNTER